MGQQVPCPEFTPAEFRVMARRGELLRRMSEKPFRTGMVFRWDVENERPVFSEHGTYHGIESGDWVQILYKRHEVSPRVFRLGAMTLDRLARRQELVLISDPFEFREPKDMLKVVLRPQPEEKTPKLRFVSEEDMRIFKRTFLDNIRLMREKDPDAKSFTIQMSSDGKFFYDIEAFK